MLCFMIIYIYLKEQVGRDRLMFPLFTNCEPIKKEFNFKEVIPTLADKI